VNLGERHQRAYGRILASLIRVIQAFDLTADALPEASAAALAR
jgi:predicted RNA polymerase sigma factor